MKEPIKEEYGWREADSILDGQSEGWIYEGGEEAYIEALVLWGIEHASEK